MISLLVRCPLCGEEVLLYAKQCPHCLKPIEAERASITITIESQLRFRGWGVFRKRPRGRGRYEVTVLITDLQSGKTEKHTICSGRVEVTSMDAYDPRQLETLGGRHQEYSAGMMYTDLGMVAREICYFLESLERKGWDVWQLKHDINERSVGFSRSLGTSRKFLPAVGSFTEVKIERYMFKKVLEPAA